ncbi:hypothetical protein Pelo_9034 [Pelomyxa schiedti]|nr:hypothetical protein Pelo_9034 [Pelomyxa schiedti]
MRRSISFVLVVVGLCLCSVRCSILVGDAMGPDRIYTLDTSTSPATVNFVYTITSPDNGAYYVSGCVDSPAGMARLLFHNSTACTSCYHILSVDLSSGIATKGTQFSLPDQLHTTEVKCDSGFHTVILMHFPEDYMSMTLYSVTPDSGEFSQVAYFTCGAEISIMNGGQVYDSEYHTYYIENFVAQRPLQREYWFATIVINIQDGSSQYVPYNNSGFMFEDPALTLQTHTDNIFVGVNVFIDDPMSALTYFDYMDDTYTYPGEKQSQVYTWAVGSTTDYEYLYQLGDPISLRAWNVESGAITTLRVSSIFTPNTFFSFYK